jgi:hypothetical protein
LLGAEAFDPVSVEEPLEPVSVEEDELPLSPVLDFASVGAEPFPPDSLLSAFFRDSDG